MDIIKSKNKALNILKKVYHYTNSDGFKEEYLGMSGYKTDFLTSKQWKILKDNNLIPNQFEKHTHDSLIANLLKLKSNKKLTFDFAKALFIKGLTGEVPRFRQTIINFLYLQKIEKHNYVKSDKFSTCAICRLPKETIEDRTHQLFTYHLGHSWNEVVQNSVVELEEILEYPMPKITEEDKNHLVNLLLFINEADENETPGKLEKRIAKAKMLPKTDKYKRYGILQALAILEILPSDEKLENQRGRSDIVMPLAGWQGSLGVDFKKAKAIFDVEFTFKL